MMTTDARERAIATLILMTIPDEKRRVIMITTLRQK